MYVAVSMYGGGTRTVYERCTSYGVEVGFAINLTGEFGFEMIPSPLLSEYNNAIFFVGPPVVHRLRSTSPK